MKDLLINYKGKISISWDYQSINIILIFLTGLKKTELVELSEINPADDPVRPELDNNFRTTKGRKYLD